MEQQGWGQHMALDPSGCKSLPCSPPWWCEQTLRQCCGRNLCIYRSALEQLCGLCHFNNRMQ